jgi:hypothetical protein
MLQLVTDFNCSSRQKIQLHDPNAKLTTVTSAKELKHGSGIKSDQSDMGGIPV